jgi:hypothetical protein
MVALTHLSQVELMIGMVAVVARVLVQMEVPVSILVDRVEQVALVALEFQTPY